MNLKVRKADPDKNIALCIYGRDGVGKSSFGAKFPNPLFVGPEIEGADFLTDIDGNPVTLVEESMNYQGLMSTIDELIENDHEYKTLVLDSIDWVETEIQDMIKTKYKVENLNDAAGGYGGGYRESFEMQVELMKKLLKLKKKMNIITVAHSTQGKVNDSMLQVEYMKTDLKIHESNNISPRAMWREAFDAVVLIDQEVTVETENNKVKTEFNNERILRFEGTERFAAKNRWPGFPREIKFSESEDIFSIIKNYISKDFYKEAMALYEEFGLDKPKLKEYIEQNKTDKTKLIAVVKRIKKGE